MNNFCRLLQFTQYFKRSTVQIYSTVWISLSFDILGFHILIIFLLALARNREKRFRPEPVLVYLLRSPGIDSQFVVPAR